MIELLESKIDYSKKLYITFVLKCFRLHLRNNFFWHAMLKRNEDINSRGFTLYMRNTYTKKNMISLFRLWKVILMYVICMCDIYDIYTRYLLMILNKTHLFLFFSYIIKVAKATPYNIVYLLVQVATKFGPALSEITRKKQFLYLYRHIASNFV